MDRPKGLGHVPAAKVPCELDIRNNQIHAHIGPQKCESTLPAAGFVHVPTRIPQFGDQVFTDEPIVFNDQNCKQLVHFSSELRREGARTLLRDLRFMQSTAKQVACRHALSGKTQRFERCSKNGANKS